MPAPPLLPAATFPPMTWFRLASLPNATVCVSENFVKQSLRNRVALVNTQGPIEVSLPVHRRRAASRSSKDVMFTAAVKPTLLLKVIRTNCGRAPFFDHYFPDIEDWAQRHLNPGQPWLDAALASTKWSCDMLGIEHPLSSTKFDNGEAWDDWRNKARWKHVDRHRYPQVFEDRLGFVPGRSILDVLFHLGPEASTLHSQHGA